MAFNTSFKDITGAFEDIFGGSTSVSGKQSMRGTGTQKSTGTELLSGKNIDPASMAALTGLIQLLTTRVSGGPDPEFSKKAALTDSKSVVAEIFREYENKLPSIFAAENAAGLTRSTDTQKLVNQAFSDAVSKASTMAMDTIIKYAGIQQQGESLDLQGILNALNISKGATQEATKSSSQTVDTEQEQTTTSEQTNEEAGLLKTIFGF